MSSLVVVSSGTWLNTAWTLHGYAAVDDGGHSEGAQVYGGVVCAVDVFYDPIWPFSTTALATHPCGCALQKHTYVGVVWNDAGRERYGRAGQILSQ